MILGSSWFRIVLLMERSDGKRSVWSGTLLFVAHTWQDEAGDEVIRLISAREATARERRAYAKSQKHKNR